MTPTVRGICTFAVYFFAMMVNKIDRRNTTPTVRGICTFAVYFFAMMVNKIDRRNTTPTVRGICTFAVYFCFVESFKLFTTRVSFRATPARALKIRHLSVLSRNILDRGCQSLFARNRSYGGKQKRLILEGLKALSDFLFPPK